MNEQTTKNYWEGIAKALSDADYRLRHSATLATELSGETARDIEGWCQDIATRLGFLISQDSRFDIVDREEVRP